MTVSTLVNKVRYLGNGVTDTFAFEGRLFSTSDLIVEIIDRATDDLIDTLVLDGGGSDGFTVSIAGPESAEIVVATPPAIDEDIQIRRDLTLSQSLDLPTGSVLPAEKIETALDRATVQLQDLAEGLARAVTIPVTSSGEPPDVISLLESVSADALQVGLDADQTAADRIQTGLDREQTALDRIQTGLDVLAALAAALQAASTFTATSVTSNSIGTGTKNFTVQTNKGFQPGQPLRASNAANIMDGTVTSYDNATGALVMASAASTGSGTFTSWNISVVGPPGSSGVGSGTVTSFSFTNGNGISGTVTNATSTPTLVMSLGNISPTKVTCSGQVNATGSMSASNLSGTNTGDQTDATLTFTDITTNNVSTSKHGFAPKLPNDASKFLNGAGAYTTPSFSPAAGGIGSLVWAYKTVSGTLYYGDTIDGGNLKATNGAIDTSGSAMAAGTTYMCLGLAIGAGASQAQTTLFQRIA